MLSVGPTKHLSGSMQDVFVNDEFDKVGEQQPYRKHQPGETRTEHPRDKGQREQTAQNAQIVCNTGVGFWYLTSNLFFESVLSQTHLNMRIQLRILCKKDKGKNGSQGSRNR